MTSDQVFVNCSEQHVSVEFVLPYPEDDGSYCCCIKITLPGKSGLEAEHFGRPIEEVTRGSMINQLYTVMHDKFDCTVYQYNFAEQLVLKFLDYCLSIDDLECGSIELIIGDMS